MIFPAHTALAAGLLALLYAGLSLWVMSGRVSDSVLIGGGDAHLQRRIRAHGNFAEYVPLILLLIALLEAGGAHHRPVDILLMGLVVARVLHPIGLFAPPNSPRQFACRGGGIITTLIVMIAAALMLLIRVA